MVSRALFACIAVVGAALPASAQPYDDGPPRRHHHHDIDRFERRTDRDGLDRGRTIAGRVAGFEPYRLRIVRRDGDEQVVDLKPGTIIRPTGATPQRGERVAIRGYYSNGTFIAERVSLRDDD